MRSESARLCESFISVRDTIREAFVWDDPYIHPAAAVIFVTHGRTPDADRMRECRKLIKQNTGIGSYFRGTAELLLMSEMSLAEDPEAYLKKVLAAYDALKKDFSGSIYLPSAAMLLADSAEEAEFARLASLSKDIFDIMNRRHRLLTSNEDVVACLTLALSGMTAEKAADETEACYSILYPDFRNNSAQALAFALALYDAPAEKKCVRTMELYTELAGRDVKWSSGIELAAIGPIAMLDGSVSDIADDLIAIDGFLSQQKGYGALGIDRKTRLMHAAMLLGIGSDRTKGEAVFVGTISVIACIQAAAMCAVISSVAATSAASAAH